MQTTVKRNTTRRIARQLYWQAQANDLLNALDVDAASWQPGQWSADVETRLAEKRAAWADASRRRDFAMESRYHEEEVLRNRLGFALSMLKSLDVRR